MRAGPRRASRLPEKMRSLFWDCDPDAIDLRLHHDFVTRRVLSRGNWTAITWLRRTLGDAALREWFLQRAGGGLEPRLLRFWALILKLPKDQVDAWVRKARASIWHGRVA